MGAHLVVGAENDLEPPNMVEIVEALWEVAQFKPGDRVKTLLGSNGWSSAL